MARTITFTLLFTALAVAGFYTANRLVETRHVERLFDENELVRNASARWLVEHRRHGRVPDLIRAIEERVEEDESDHVQPAEGLRAAASELARPRHVALFVSLLENEALQGWSLEVLDRFVPLPESALRVLGELLDHEGDDIFALAASLLGRSGQRAVSTLVRNIRYLDDDGTRRDHLLNMMRETMGPVAKAAVPSLREKLEVARSERLFDDFSEEIGFAVEERYLLSVIDDTVDAGEFLEPVREEIERQLVRLRNGQPATVDEDEDEDSPVGRIYACLDQLYFHSLYSSGFGPILLKLARLRDHRLVDRVVTIASETKVPDETRAAVLIEALRTPEVDLCSAFESLLGVCESSPRSVRRIAPWVVALLDHYDPAIRKAAAETLRDLGPGAHAALEPLQERLGELDSPLRASVTLATALCEAEDEEFRRRLAAFLKDPPEGEPSRELVFAISHFGERGGVLRPVLFRELESDDEERRILAACALLRIYSKDPAALHQLRATLRTGRWSQRALAVESMVDFEVRVPQLLSDIAGVLERQPRLTCQLLAALGGPAFPVLLEAAESEDFDTHEPAVEALTNLQLDEADIPSLWKQLGHRVREYRALAVHLLGGFGPAAAAAEHDLLQALDDADFKVQRLAIEVLGKLGPAAREAPRRLTKYLTDPAFRDLKSQAKNALGKMGKAAVPALKKALNVTEGHARIDVTEVLVTIGDREQLGINALIAMLGDPSPDLRYAAANSLRWLGAPAVAEAIPTLIDALGDPDAEVCGEAIDALVHHPTDSPLYIDAMIDGLRNRVGRAFHVPLVGMGPSAVGPLLDALDGADDDLTSWIVFTLGRIGPESKDAIPALNGLLSSTNWVTRANAIQALGRIGPTAERTRPAIRERLQDPVEAVRRYVPAALARIEGKIPPRPRDDRTFEPPDFLCGSSDDTSSFHEEFCSRRR